MGDHAVCAGFGPILNPANHAQCDDGIVWAGKPAKLQPGSIFILFSQGVRSSCTQSGHYVSQRALVATGQWLARVHGVTEH